MNFEGVFQMTQKANDTESKKIFVMGIDGMDPRLTCKYIKEGIMPNTKKFIERGSAREDLVMLGGHPTVTPPMWTTLATGAYPITHGMSVFRFQIQFSWEKAIMHWILLYVKRNSCGMLLRRLV